MKIKMSVAAAFYDSFTGKQIPPELLQIKTEEEISYVIKDGYFCFLNSKESKLELTVSAKNYQSKKQVFDLTDSKNPYHIWMLPAKNYPFPEKATVLEGQGLKPDLELKLVLKPKKAKMRLKQSLEKNSETVEIISALNWEKAGRNYMLSAEKAKKEWIYLSEEIEENVYLLKSPIKNSYQAETPIYPVYHISPDKNGNFYIPLGEVTEDCEAALINNKKEEITFTLQKGGRYAGGEKVFLEGFIG